MITQSKILVTDAHKMNTKIGLLIGSAFARTNKKNRLELKSKHTQSDGEFFYFATKGRSLSELALPNLGLPCGLTNARTKVFRSRYRFVTAGSCRLEMVSVIFSDA